MFEIHRAGWRILSGAGAYFLTDLILGMTAFSVIILGILWYFSLGWIRLTMEFSQRGVVFGSSAQLLLAWVGVIVALPMLATTVLLAIRAFRLPGQVLKVGRAKAH
jgi:hypothetical protein